MSDRIKLAALLGVAIVAMAMLGVVVYNVVANDWRLDGNPLDLSFLTGEEDSELDADVRTLSRSLRFGDSVRAISVETHALRISVGASGSDEIEVRFSLSGDATDSALYRATAAASDGGLRIAAGPTGALGNATGSLELSVPPSLTITIHSRGGDVTLVNVAASLDITADAGSVELSGVGGSLRARAGGEIALDGCRLDSADLRADGPVSLMLTEGAIRAAGSGVQAGRHFGALDARASGAIRAEILSNDAPIRLESDGGDVHLRVLDGARFAFDVAAPTGTIVANVPFDTLTPENATEHFVRATMNGGGVPAVIRAGRGSVEILLFEGGEPSAVESHVEDATSSAGLVLRAVQPLSDRARRTVEGPRRDDHRAPRRGV
jgi:hypothetical protein